MVRVWVITIAQLLSRNNKTCWPRSIACEIKTCQSVLSDQIKQTVKI